MSRGLFAYPKQAEFGRVLPKNKIYEKTKVSASLKKKFVAQIDKIVWQFKLSPETLNLPAKKNVPEIEVFRILLREAELHNDILKCIDNAIPFPVIYELVFNGKIKTKAAFKRPSDADSNKWVTDIYFETPWLNAEAEREVLPVALDLGVLYEKLLGSLMPVTVNSGEDLRSQVERLTEIRHLETQGAKLESQMRKEKQFNRKVELNAELRNLKKQMQEITSNK